MKNFWLGRLRTGKRVKYKGPDSNLKDKSGYVARAVKNQKGQVVWVDVNFEFGDKGTKTLTVEPEYVEVI